MIRSISVSRPTTGSSLPSAASLVRLRPNWSSSSDTNGGFGPQEFGRLFEVGSYTPDSSYGWWSIFVDAGGTNIYLAAQTNDVSSNMTVYLSAPIDWTTNYFHFVAVTYSPTNTALYVDGDLVTNGAPMTIYPGADVLTNGFYVGSDSNGFYQAHGLFNTVETFNYPLSADDILANFNYDLTWYRISPWNLAMELSSSIAPSTNDLSVQFSSGVLSITVPLSTVGTNYMFDVFATTNLSPNVP